MGGSGSGGSGGGRSPGIIALIVLAVLALICLLLAACWFGYRRFGNPFTGGYKPSAQARYDHLERGELLTSPRAQAAKDKVCAWCLVLALELLVACMVSCRSGTGVARQAQVAVACSSMAASRWLCCAQLGLGAAAAG